MARQRSAGSTRVASQPGGPRSRQQLAELLEAAVQRRGALGLGVADSETNAYRLLHEAADGAPGVCVDVYDRWLVAHFYDIPAPLTERDWLDALAALPFEGVYLKRRPRQSNTLADAERAQRAPAAAVRGISAPDKLTVRESGVPLVVSLGDGLSTGLFLDQRDNRRWVRECARDARVLNLFAYTCAFGVFAALGGARETTNVDLSRTVLARGRENYGLSGLALEGHRFWARDVLELLQRMHRREERFDLIVLDPPSYASGKRTRFSAERDYGALCQRAIEVLAEGGALLSCCNHQAMSEAFFGREVADAVARSGRATAPLERLDPPADFPVLGAGKPHLKSRLVQLLP